MSLNEVNYPKLDEKLSHNWTKIPHTTEAGVEETYKIDLITAENETPYKTIIEWSGILSYDLTQSGVALIEEMGILNGTCHPIKDLTIQIKSKESYIKPFEIVIEELESGQSVEFTPRVHIEAQKLFELSEMIDDEIHLTISAQMPLTKVTDEPEVESEIIYAPFVLLERIKDIPVLPINQWSGVSLMPESIASFVLPNIPKIHELQTRATQILKELSGDSSFTSYYSDDKNVVRQQLAAIYATIYEQNISYAAAPPSYLVGQRVRLPHEVLTNKMGNCIEMAVLFSSLCEAFSLNSFIIIIEGHAFVGAWLKDSLFESNVVKDISEVKKRLAEGINDIEILEATYLNGDSGKTFEQACRRARDLIDDETKFNCLVDVYRSHRTGIRPMPVQVIENGETKIMDFGLADDASTKGVVAKTIEEHFLDTTQKDTVDKRTIWMRHLLDLSKRNSLISFKKGNKTIQLFASNLSDLEDALSKGDAFTLKEISAEWGKVSKKVSFEDVESRQELVDRISAIEFKSKIIRTFMTKETLDSTAKTLYRDAKKALEETGSNTLYLAMGFLRWFDPNDIRTAEGQIEARYAPLVLVPVELKRRATGHYQITLRDEDAQLNTTLLGMLRQNFDLHIGGLDPLPLDDHGVDLTLIFNSIRQAVIDKKGWDVVEMACLGLFSFSQFVMWNDLRTRFDELTKNKVVKALSEGLYTDHPEEDFDVEMIDQATSVQDVVVPSSIDSSQLAAIIDAANSNSFVLHGPPGTGKSQTITNMIANAVYQQKTVIFVAEKMAALEVVKNRLTEIGLGDYLLELHSNKTQKKVLLDKLENSLNLKSEMDNQAFEEKAKEIQVVRDRLNQTIDYLHKLQSNGKSIYDYINEYERQEGAPKLFNFKVEQLANLTPVQENKWHSLINELNRSINHLDVPYFDHPLKEWQKNGYTLGGVQQATDLMNTIKNQLDTISQKLQQFSLPEAKAHELLDSSEKLKVLKQMTDVIKETNLKTELTPETFRNLVDADYRAEMKDIIEQAATFAKLNDKLMERYGQSILTYDYVKGKNDFLEASNKLFFKGSKQKEALQELNSHARGDFMVNFENAHQEFDALSVHRDYYNELNSKIERMVKTFNILVDVSPEDVDAIDDLYILSQLIVAIKQNQTQTIPELFELYKLIQDFQFEEPNPITELVNQYNQLNQLLADFEDMTGFDYQTFKQQENWTSELPVKLTEWETHLDKWKNWSSFYDSVQRFEAEQLDNIIQDLWREPVDTSEDNLVRSFKASLARDLIQYHIEQSDELSRFNGMSFEGQIEEYNRLIDEFEAISQEQIKIKLSQNLPTVKNTSKAEQKQLAVINRVIRSKGRGISIRTVFQENSLIIRRMAPILLMSPLSVAQYIDPSSPPFDLVIFDEASQIKTSNAIGAMSRAKDCIIVGDPNQMPPTSFFSSQSLDEENLHLEALESLLEDCLAINMPQRYLSWHYRSHSESLITFSNKMYYSSKMKTFPSPFDRISKIQFHKVDGVYDRGVTQTNRVEAEAIVEDIKHRLRDPKLVNDSIGVVTFNSKQQYLIDDLFQEALKEDKALADIVEKLEEPIFIKNLESVQGDERDVIMFSINFGPDEDGKFTSNFGPLNKKGGWRRLNVAVSRARKEMVIYASIEPRDIKVRATSPDGLVGVQRFLEFAQTGRMSHLTAFENRNQSAQDSMLDSVVTFLKDAGYQVDRQVGTSDIRIDLAVVDPRNPDYYLTAIRLDNKQYAGSKTARDRNRLVPGVLKVRGWNVYSLWTLDWYDNRLAEQQRLITYLEELADGVKPDKNILEEVSNETPIVGETENNVESIEEVVPDEAFQNDAISDQENEAKSDLTQGDFESINQKIIEENNDVISRNQSNINSLSNEAKGLQVGVLSQSIPESMEATGDELVAPSDESADVAVLVCQTYEKYIHPETYEASTLQDNAEPIVNMMQAVVDLEAPITNTELFKRVLEAYPGARLTQNTTQYLQRCLNKVKKRTNKQGNQSFLWSSDSDWNQYLAYRLPEEGDRRDLDTISDYELANLLWDIVLVYEKASEQATPISQDELLKSATRQLGYARHTEKMTQQCKTAVTNAIRRKLLKREKDGLVSVESE